MAYGDFKDLNGIIVVNKVLHDKVLNIAKNRKWMDINVDLFQWSINLLRKKLQMEQLKMKLFLIKNHLKNYSNHLLEN